ncbi:MAG: hypothetical protein ABIS86_19095, partial [Streptosporangiaceae bacterium]
FDGWLALRRWYRTLRSLAQVPADRELVLAVGLLTWTSADGVAVRNHLLSTPVRVGVDPETERVDVVVGDRPTVLQDRDLLEDLAGFRPARTDWLRDAVRTGQGTGLQDSVADVLRKWCGFAFDEPIAFREDWTDDLTGGGSRVRLAPALVLRPRSETALIDYLDGMLAELKEGRLPAGLARFLRPGPDDRLAHVRDRSAFGDLLTALLARGQRVLVTTATPEEVHDTLPPELTELAVTVVGDRSDLDLRLQGLAGRYSAYDPERYERALAEHRLRVRDLDHEVAVLRSRLAQVQQAQTLDLGPGYTGTYAEVASRLTRAYPWMPVITGLPERPPLTAPEAAELVELLGGQTPARRARTAQLLPEPGALPGVEQVRALITVAQIPAPDPAAVNTDFAQRLADSGPAVIDRLDACAAAVTAILAELGVSADWTGPDWTARALNDGLSGRGGRWEHLAELAARAAAADRALRTVGARWVTLPTGPEGELLAAARELREHLSAGGTLKRGPLKSAAQKRAEPLLAGSTVEGEHPGTPELLDVVIAALEGRQACADLLAGWSDAGVELDHSLPLDRTVALFAVLYTKLGQVRTALLAVSETEGLLRRIGLTAPLNSPGEWQAYRAALETVRIRRRASTAWAALASLRQAIELEIRQGQAPPELPAAAAALSARDLAGYARCLQSLAEAHGERLRQLRCDALMNRLAAAHPALAAAPAIVPAEWDDAWTWAYVSSSLQNRPRSAIELELADSLERAAELSAQASASLAAAEAWGWALSRVGGRPSAAALPVWIMPLAQVPATVPGSRDSFDVVVVDAAGEGAEALFLLWLAPRVIIVGEGAPVPSGAAVSADSTLFGALAARFTVMESGVVVTPTLPAPAAARPTRDASGSSPADLEPGRSIVTYQRPELVELVTRLASDAELSDEQLIDYARALLDCPEDEHLIVGARLRYAVEAMRTEASHSTK